MLEGFYETRSTHSLVIDGLVLLVGSDGPVDETVRRRRPKRECRAGRVTSHAKGLTGAVVMVWRQPAPAPQPGALTAKTDSNGNYRIEGVSAGNYFISVEASDFVDMEQERPWDQPRRLSLSGKEMLNGIDFDLLPGGTVSGTVKDNTGTPMAKEQVLLTWVDPKPGPTMFVSFKWARTDDLGTFKVPNVVPGRYTVSAGSQSSGLTIGSGRPAYRRTFYPDVSDESKAKVIEVKEAGEVSNVDINVGAPIKIFAIAGRIIDANTGQPVPNTRYALNIFKSGRPAGRISQAGTSNESGEFRVDRVPQGSYSVSVPASLIPVDEPATRFLGESVPVDVSNQDVSGIEVRVVAGASVSGVVILEGTSDRAAIAKQLQRRLVISSIPKPPGRVSTWITNLGADGSFSVSGLGAGSLSLQFMSADVNEPTLFRWERLERNSVELPRNMEINSGDQISGLRIILVYAIGSVRGQVKLENGSLLQNTPLVVRLYADNPRDTANLPGAFVDSRGHFLLENVPAGKYKLSVQNWTSGTLIKAARQDIVVAEGGVADVTVVVEPQPHSKP